MTAHVALLRAVNVAGHNKVAMADLRAMLADLGFGCPQSYIQSGNLLFTADGRTPVELEQLLEHETKVRLGLVTAYLVRTAEAWSAMIDANPFPGQPERDPGRLVAMPLKAAPSEAALDDLRGRIVGREQVHAVDSTLYVVYADGIGRSKLTTRLIETALGVQGTGRNWKTVLKLREMLAA